MKPLLRGRSARTARVQEIEGKGQPFSAGAEGCFLPHDEIVYEKKNPR